MSAERIKLHDSFQDIFVKMSDGNPGAVNVLMTIIQQGGGIDPTNMLGPLAPILSLDSCAIYGSRIWMLWKDVCGQRLPEFLAVLRAWQLGILTRERLDASIDGREAICVETLLAQVRERLPNFAKPPEAANHDESEVAK